jgi:oxygen-independent coproporphyrinogen-3 oxidase
LDDRIRQEVLQQLYSFGRVDLAAIERLFSINFRSYFDREWGHLSELQSQGIVELTEGIEVTEPLGRLLVRVPAAVFDRYLPPRAFMEGLPAGQSSAVG